MSDPQSLTPDQLQRLVNSVLAREGKIQAIKVYRERTGTSLRDAKHAVEAIEAQGPLPNQQAATTTDCEPEVVRLLGQGRPLQAVKLYKDQTGSNLREAQQAVERLALRHGLPMQVGGGCGGVVAILLLAGIVVVAIGGAVAIWLGLVVP